MEHWSAATSDFVVRQMTQPEVKLALEWAAFEGWNPGLADAQSFYRADPNGFFIAELSGTPVGCLAAVAYDLTFGFLGLYIVRPEFRGRGFGLQLSNCGLAYLGQRNIGLEDVVTQQAKYRRLGFYLAHRNMRYEGMAQGLPRAQCVALQHVPFADIYAYDCQLFPSPREDFLRSWIHQPGSLALGYMNAGKLYGYGVLRPCRQGYRIGPLFADTPRIAENLLSSLCAGIIGESFFLDVPESNPAAIALAERYMMRKVFETARMYTGTPPPLPIDRIFGITTCELG